MKKWIMGCYFVFIILSFASYAYADQAPYDPLQRNLIWVEGQAEQIVPINAFRIRFGFDVDRATFSDSRNTSDQIIEKIRSDIKELGLQNFEIVKGWDLVKQEKISLGAKGRKISNQVIVDVKEFPQGQLHELIAAIIDKALIADSSVVLEDLAVYVTDEVENQKKQELFIAALKALRVNAEQAASALGRNLGEPKRIFSSEDTNIPSGRETLLADIGGSMFRESLVHIRKSFKVDSQISDHEKISAHVTGLYQLN